MIIESVVSFNYLARADKVCDFKDSKGTNVGEGNNLPVWVAGFPTWTRLLTSIFASRPLVGKKAKAFDIVFVWGERKKAA